MERGRDSKKVMQDRDINYELMIHADFLSRKAKKAFLHVPYTAICPGDGMAVSPGKECMEGVIDEFGNYFSFNEPYGYFMDTPLPEEE